MPLGCLVRDICISRFSQILAISVMCLGALAQPSNAAEESDSLSRIVGSSSQMEALRQQIRRYAPESSSALIVGETGTGKELVAQALHLESPRHKEPFIAVNCSAISPGLVESTLFGHVKGAFTGADNQRIGLFEHAGRGTLFLDEVAHLPLDSQRTLLRALEDRTILRVGAENKPIPFKARVVAAMNTSPEQEVADGKFAHDLFYRLDRLRIATPALRERASDIAELANHFLAVENAQRGKSAQFAPDAIAALSNYAWPGNVRQLNTVVHRLAIDSDSTTIDAKPVNAMLTQQIGENKHSKAQLEAALGLHVGRPLRDVLADVERFLYEQALQTKSGDRRETAKYLGVPRSTIYRDLVRLGIVHKAAEQAKTPTKTRRPIQPKAVTAERKHGDAAAHIVQFRPREVQPLPRPTGTIHDEPS